MGGDDGDIGKVVSLFDDKQLIHFSNEQIKFWNTRFKLLENMEREEELDQKIEAEKMKKNITTEKIKNDLRSIFKNEDENEDFDDGELFNSDIDIFDSDMENIDGRYESENGMNIMKSSKKKITENKNTSSSQVTSVTETFHTTILPTSSSSPSPIPNLGSTSAIGPVSSLASSSPPLFPSPTSNLGSTSAIGPVSSFSSSSPPFPSPTSPVLGVLFDNQPPNLLSTQLIQTQAGNKLDDHITISSIFSLDQ
jgi:hypothetical protein